jgi:hypothetical protein
MLHDYVEKMYLPADRVPALAAAAAGPRIEVVPGEG